MTAADHEPRTGSGRCLSVVMPCFNEAATVLEITRRILESPYVAELVVVDDGSRDGTAELVRSVADERVRVFEQPYNLGKGAALRRGFAETTAPFVVVQDADLEYDPREYGRLLEPLLDGRADVVYGSRFIAADARRVLYYWHTVGNRLLTTLSNMFSDLNLTDMETCYKAFRREVLASFELQEDRFGIEPEITAKVARTGWRVYEVGIGYAGRTYAEGKKIGWRDGFRALYAITRYSPLLERLNGHPVVRTEPAASFEEADADLEEVLDTLSDADEYADWIYRELEPYLGHAVLEVGAGHGEFTERLRSGRTVTATDLSERCIGELRRRFDGDPAVEVLAADVTQIPGSDRFDSAVLVNVLEHVGDDLGMLRELRRLIKPGGHVLVFAPAFDGLYSDFDRQVGHYRRYRASHLAMLGDRAGYEVVDIRYFNSAGAVLWWLFARRLRRIPTARWSVRAFDTLAVPVLSRIESRWRPRFGQSVVFVGVKPGHDAA